MKAFTILLILAGMLTCNNLHAQNLASANDAATINGNFSWTTSTEYDFGKIKQGVPVTTEFAFTNSGNAPIEIFKVKASCGCTTPDYSREPIEPGKNGFVKATFNAGTVGVFKKSINITSNANEKDVILYIKGEVIL